MKNKAVKRWFIALLPGLCALLTLTVPVLAQFSAGEEYRLVGYGEDAQHNRVARLKAAMDRGEVTLQFREERGYLDDFLAALNIDPSSQMLVFSPTSLQHKLINPRTPRALYFNDDTYIGFVQNSTIVEVGTIDEKQGIVFYTLDNAQDTEQVFERTNQTCLVCHDTQGTMGGGVPMLMALSTVYTRDNLPLLKLSGVGNVSDTTPLADRWGGWYVTGRHGLQAHLGNLMLPDKNALESLDDYRIWNVDSLSAAGYLDTDPYPADTSDITALLVLEHQVTVQNHLTYIRMKAPAVLQRRGLEAATSAKTWEQLPPPARQALTRMLDRLVDSLLFVDAAPYASAISGRPDYAAWFEAQGPFDDAGRSLREFDLRTRLFRYPFSYLVYTADFDALPAYALDYVYRQLAGILSGEISDARYSHLDPDMRRVITEILHDTKPAMTPYLTRVLAQQGDTAGDSWR